MYIIYIQTVQEHIRANYEMNTTQQAWNETMGYLQNMSKY